VEEQAPIRPEVSGGDGKVEEEANPQFKRPAGYSSRRGKGATPAGKTAAALSKGESVPETIVLGERAPDVIAGFNPTTITDPMGKAATAEQKKIIKRQDIARELSEKLGVPIRVGKFNMRALGIFKPGQQVVRIKGGGKSGGLPTIFHEVAHFLDYQIGFSQLLNKVEREALMEEYGYKYSGNARKQEQEGFAEFVRFYMTGQKERAHNLAPEFYAKFERIMLDLPEVKEVIDKAAEDYARWKTMPASAKVFSQISVGKQTDKLGVVDKLTVNANELYTLAIDDLHPLSEFAELAKVRLHNRELRAQDNPYLLARNLRGWTGRAQVFLTKGTFGAEYYREEKGKVVPNYTGKSFDEINQAD